MMKRIVEINTTNYASTGNIMLNIAKLAREKGYDVYTCCKAEALEKFPGPRNLKRIVLLKNRNTRYGTLDMWKPMII